MHPVRADHLQDAAVQRRYRPGSASLALDHPLAHRALLPQRLDVVLRDLRRAREAPAAELGRCERLRDDRHRVVGLVLDLVEVDHVRHDAAGAVGRGLGVGKLNAGAVGKRLVAHRVYDLGVGKNAGHALRLQLGGERARPYGLGEVEVAVPPGLLLERRHVQELELRYGYRQERLASRQGHRLAELAARHDYRVRIQRLLEQHVELGPVLEAERLALYPEQVRQEVRVVGALDLFENLLGLDKAGDALDEVSRKRCHVTPCLWLPRSGRL